jgi:hypothetical protein
MQNSGVALQINLPEAKGVFRQFRAPQVPAMSICRCAAFAFHHMVSSLFDPAPHCGDHSHSVSTVNAESEHMIRHIPHVFGGKPEKSP